MTAILKVDTIQDTSGNNIINESSDTITIGASGDTTNIVGTLQNNGAAVGGANTPAFKARSSADQSLSNATAAKVTLGTEVFDTDNAFASDKFTVPSGKAGKYFLSFQLSLEGQNDIRQMKGMIYKNGSAINDANFKLGMNSNLIDAGTEMFFNTNGILDLAVGDYVEAYVYIYNTAGGVYVAKDGKNFFQGYRIIE